FTEIPPRFANRVNVTLKDVMVYNVSSGGIHMTGTHNKLTTSATIIDNNSNNSQGGGIFVDGGALLELGEGTIVSNNHANGSANGGGIAAINALTITVSGGVTITGNTA